MIRSRPWVSVALSVAASGVVLSVAGCTRGAAPAPAPDPTIHAAPAPARPQPSSPEVRATARPASPAGSVDPPRPPPGPAFLLTELAPTQGDLTPLLVTQFERAQGKHLRPVVEFYADWCAPCRAVQASLKEPRMAAALHGVFLIKLNLDDWHDKLKDTGFTVKAIPMFFLVGADGRPTGKPLDGDKWGAPTPANMAAAITRFLAK